MQGLLTPRVGAAPLSSGGGQVDCVAASGRQDMLLARPHTHRSPPRPRPRRRALTSGQSEMEGLQAEAAELDARRAGLEAEIADREDDIRGLETEKELQAGGEVKELGEEVDKLAMRWGAGGAGLAGLGVTPQSAAACRGPAPLHAQTEAAESAASGFDPCSPAARPPPPLPQAGQGPGGAQEPQRLPAGGEGRHGGDRGGPPRRALGPARRAPAGGPEGRPRLLQPAAWIRPAVPHALAPDPHPPPPPRPNPQPQPPRPSWRSSARPPSRRASTRRARSATRPRRRSRRRRRALRPRRASSRVRGAVPPCCSLGFERKRQRPASSFGCFQRPKTPARPHPPPSPGAEAGDGRDESNRSMQERLADAVNAQTAADAEIKVGAPGDEFSWRGLSKERTMRSTAPAAAYSPA
jgi:hypothetical protein